MRHGVPTASLQPWAPGLDDQGASVRHMNAKKLKVTGRTGA